MSEQPKITREDLEKKFRTLQADIQGRAEDKKQSVVATAGTVAVVVVIGAYLLGRRKGRKRAGRVEFRRF
jgi:hypothetical protein